MTPSGPEGRGSPEVGSEGALLGSLKGLGRADGCASLSSKVPGGVGLVPTQHATTRQQPCCHVGARAGAQVRRSCVPCAVPRGRMLPFAGRCTDTHSGCRPQSREEPFIFCHVVRGPEVETNNVFKDIPVWRGQHDSGTCTLKVEGAVEMHNPVPSTNVGVWVLSISGEGGNVGRNRVLHWGPLRDEVSQDLAFDRVPWFEMRSYSASSMAHFTTRPVPSRLCKIRPRG